MRTTSRAARATLAFVVWGFWPTTATAQSDANPVLAPGNELLLVIPEPKPTRHVVVIDPEGRLALSNYATIEAAGLTLEEANARTREALSKFIVRTAAITLVRTDDKHFVVIEGHVEKPGPARVDPKANIWQGIHAAGGPAEGADLARVELVRDGKEQLVDIQAYLERATKDLPRLRAGDKVVVPKGVGPGGQSTPRTDLARLENKVFVFGAVRNPGLYHRAPGLTVLTAVGIAGGPTDSADLASVRLLSPELSRSVNLERQMLGERPPTVVPERGGALVFVPRVRQGEHQVVSKHINVIGGVNGAGRITVSAPVSLLDAVALGGGPKADADLDDARLVRVGEGFVFTARYDLERLTEEGSVASLVRLYPGDTLFVDEDAFEVWRSIIKFVSDLAIITGSIVVFATLASQ